MFRQTPCLADFVRLGKFINSERRRARREWEQEHGATTSGNRQHETATRKRSQNLREELKQSRQIDSNMLVLSAKLLSYQQRHLLVHRNNDKGKEFLTQNHFRLSAGNNIFRFHLSVQTHTTPYFWDSDNLRICKPPAERACRTPWQSLLYRRPTVGTKAVSLCKNRQC